MQEGKKSWLGQHKVLVIVVVLAILAGGWIIYQGNRSNSYSDSIRDKSEDAYNMAEEAHRQYKQQ